MDFWRLLRRRIYNRRGLKKKSLIVFDIDGTLTDSVKIHQQSFTEALHEIGVTAINSEFKTFKHHTDSYIVKEIYENNFQKPFSKEKFIQFEKILTEKISCEKINEIKGVKKMIEFLENKTDFGICYATGSLRRAAELKLKSINIKFDSNLLIASDDIYEREGIVSNAIENALKYYQVEKFDRIISVGDGLWDLLTAQNLGLEFIGIGLKNKEILIQNGAKIVFKNLTKFKVN